MASNLIKAIFAGDSASLEAALKRVSGAAGKTDTTLRSKLSTGAKVASAALLGSLVVGAKRSIDAASNLGEQVSKTGVVFGSAGDDIIAFSKTTATSLGISQRAALEATGTFGNMLVPMGLARPEAAKMSKAMVGLAADMASFNNASPEETLDALRSGLAGETEPLRRYGVFLDAASVKQEAVRMGLAKSKGELTAAAKAQASYSLILKQSTDAQGDFARTSDGAANQQRINAAQAEDLAATLGQSLLPAYTALLRTANDVVGFAKDHAAETKILVGVLGGLAAAILSVNTATKAYKSAQTAANALSSIFVKRVAVQTAATGAAAGAQEGLNVAMRANVIGIVITAIAALAVGLIYAYKKSETFRDIVQGAFNVVKGAAKGALTVVQGVVDAVVKTIGFVKDLLGLGKHQASGTTASVVGKGEGTNLRDVQRSTKEFAKATNEAYSDGLRETKGRVAVALSEVVRDAIATAKQNVTSLGADLSSRVAAGIDKRAATAVGALANTPQAARLKAIEDGLKAEGDARDKAELEMAVSSAETAEDRADAEVRLREWTLEQEADALRTYLADEQTKIEDQAEIRKTAFDQGVTDLTDALNRGLETQTTFNDKLKALLTESGGDYQDIGLGLGTAFAQGFGDALADLQAQVTALLGGPMGTGSGAGGTTTNPLGVAARDWADRRRALSASLRDAKAAAREEDSAGGTTITKGEGTTIRDLARALQSMGTKNPFTTNNFTINALDPRAAAAAVMESIRIYERTTGQQFVRV